MAIMPQISYINIANPGSTRMNSLQIRIKIADKDYTLMVSPGEEALLQQAGKLLNEQLKQMTQRTGIWDKQDLLARIAFDSTVNKLRQEQYLTDGIEQIDRISSDIEQVLRGD